MKKIIIVLILLIFVHVNLYAKSNVSKIKTKYAISAVKRLKIYKQANFNSQIIGELDIVSKIKILSSSSNMSSRHYMNDYWYKIKFEKIIGYAYGYYLCEYSKKNIIVSKKQGKIFFNISKKIVDFRSEDDFFNRLKYWNKKGEDTILHRYKNEKSPPYDYKYDIIEILEDEIVVIAHNDAIIDAGGSIGSSTIINKKGRIIYNNKSNSQNSMITTFYIKKNKKIIIFPTFQGYGYLAISGECLIINIRGDVLMKSKLNLHVRGYAEYPDYPEYQGDIGKEMAAEGNEVRYYFSAQEDYIVLDENNNYIICGNLKQFMLVDLNNNSLFCSHIKIPMHIIKNVYLKDYKIRIENNIVKFMFTLSKKNKSFHVPVKILIKYNIKKGMFKIEPPYRKPSYNKHSW